MFDYNKRFWDKVFSPDDGEETPPYQTYYMPGIALGLLVGGAAGYLMGSPGPLASLGAAAGMWIGNSIRR